MAGEAKKSKSEREVLQVTARLKRDLRVRLGECAARRLISIGEALVLAVEAWVEAEEKVRRAK